MPRCLGTSGLVRARQIPMSARAATEVHTFWPSRTQPPSTRVARVVSAARSEPAPGSLNSWHQSSSPRRVGPTHRSVCSGVPWAMMVGRAQAATARLGRRSPASAQTWSMTSCSTAPASRPQGRASAGPADPGRPGPGAARAGSSMAAMAATTGASSARSTLRLGRELDGQPCAAGRPGPAWPPRPATAPCPRPAGGGWWPGAGGCGRRAPR